jgi:hypothetical protein
MLTGTGHLEDERMHQEMPQSWTGARAVVASWESIGAEATREGTKRLWHMEWGRVPWGEVPGTTAAEAPRAARKLPPLPGYSLSQSNRLNLCVIAATPHALPLTKLPLKLAGVGCAPQDQKCHQHTVCKQEHAFFRGPSHKRLDSPTQTHSRDIQNCF